MRTAADFNRFYARPDPWRISSARLRDKILRRSLIDLIRGKSVLELGCGEGHLTRAVFDEARSVTGIDISDVAIDRAKALALPNAQFENLDFLQASFSGYDVITALECLYYLSPDEQERFFAKVAKQHEQKPLIISGPIIGENQHRKYFTHAGLVETLQRHGFLVAGYRNLYVNRTGLPSTIAAALVRTPFCLPVIDWLPESFIYQRCYVARTA